ncbi:dehydrogenase with different specificitie [Rhizodiscina lignyota]|uniref:Dehydrogenase with different specificitie n=1 Tax=Rhizodiscina lignyota TaxID=1504668 RepID=A0A9P4IGS7_9PEZI|nr:dehydrogenase with different specificitie [Rhizodiscina lignyota]
MSAIAINKLFSVEGAVVVVTGGGSGLGRMMANALAENGAAKVYIIGRRKEKLEEVAKGCKGGVVVPLVGDVTSKDSIESIVEQVKADSGYVNVVVANSGHSGPTMHGLPQNPSIANIRKHIMSQPMEDFTHTFAVNVTGMFYTCVAFLELLDAGNKKGNMPPTVRSQVIATGSIGGYNKNIGVGYPYNASKTAVHHLIKMLSIYLGPHKIRANALAPGLFPSDISAPLLAGKDGTQEGAFPANFIPAEKTGDDQDMAGAILYLTSRAGAYLNGNILVIDGGRMGVLNTSY